MSGSVRLGRLAAFLGSIALAAGQTVENSNDPRNELRAQMQELRAALDDVRCQLDGSRSESQELRKELDAMRDQLAELRLAPAPAPPVAPSKTDEPIAALTEQQQLADAKLSDQNQTKVASGSRYRVRLSGLAL